MHDTTGTIRRSICVFCGSSFGTDPSYRAGAARLGRYLAEHQLTLVYGGGSIGLMGELARRAMNAGGRVIGIIPKNIHERIEDIDLTEKIILDNMHDRKAAMYEASDAFVVMPGGLGTFDEFFEIFTWFQLGYHEKPIGLFNINGYFDGLISYLSHAVNEGFIQSAFLDTLIVEPEVDDLMNRIAAAKPSAIDKLEHK